MGFGILMPEVSWGAVCPGSCAVQSGEKLKIDINPRSLAYAIIIPTQNPQIRYFILKFEHGVIFDGKTRRREQVN